ncbi:MAG: hypothetical protein PWP30_2260 [Eubacteriaceae bacterium]|nr:hypothetical protein [Eubacteriaceae bacterium]
MDTKLKIHRFVISDPECGILVPAGIDIMAYNWPEAIKKAMPYLLLADDLEEDGYAYLKEKAGMELSELEKRFIEESRRKNAKSNQYPYKRKARL